MVRNQLVNYIRFDFKRIESAHPCSPDQGWYLMRHVKQGSKFALPPLGEKFLAYQHQQNIFACQFETLSMTIFKMQIKNVGLAVPSPRVPVSRLEKRAYRKECIDRPILAAPSNTGSFICDGNDVDGELAGDEHDLEHDFDDDYHSRLADEYEERARKSHEENVHLRHEHLKQRLDLVSQEVERLKPYEDEVVKLRNRVHELEGEVMKLRSINRSYQRNRTQR